MLVVAMCLLMSITAGITYYLTNRIPSHCECRSEMTTTAQTNPEHENSTKAPPKDKDCVSKAREFAINGVQYFALGEGEARNIFDNTTTKTVSDLQVEITM